MAVHLTPVDEFLRLSATHPVLDVRSPGEYQHAHIPAAHSLPLFTDEERAAIGTAYKQQSRAAAIKLGLTAFGPKMKELVEQAEHLVKNDKHPASPGTLLVHCWRGGMRSEAVAWLLSLYGFEVHMLEGGYKSYRSWVLRQIVRSYHFKVIGGNTGAGKTAVLHALQQSGYCVLDLEDLAKHRGSAFGGLQGTAQPGQEQFENNLADRLCQLTAVEADTAIFVEDESQRIGNVNLPQHLYQRIRQQEQFFLDVPFEARLDYLCKEYGDIPVEVLINAIVRIKKRLGPLETNTAISHLVENDKRAAFHVLLMYYDKQYAKLQQTREAQQTTIHKIPCRTADGTVNARSLITYLTDIHANG